MKEEKLKGGKDNCYELFMEEKELWKDGGEEQIMS